MSNFKVDDIVRSKMSKKYYKVVGFTAVELSDGHIEQRIRICSYPDIRQGQMDIPEDKLEKVK